MKNILLATVAIFSFVNIGFTSPATAQSQAECSIWLCLPGGFPAGCGAAKAAMLKRVRKGRSPLPTFSGCAAKTEYTNPSDFTYSYNHVLHMAETQECVEWQEEDSSDDADMVCVKYKTLPERYVPGTSCYTESGEDREWIRGCLAALREIKIFEKGELVGEPFYF